METTKSKTDKFTLKLVPSILILLPAAIRLIDVQQSFLKVLLTISYILSAPFIVIGGSISEFLLPHKMSGGWTTVSFDILTGNEVMEIIVFILLGLLINNFTYYTIRKQYKKTNKKWLVVLITFLVYATCTFLGLLLILSATGFGL